MLDEAAALASGTEYGLSLGILSRDVMKAMELAERIKSDIVHINDQTINDEAVAPFGGVGASGSGSRFGGAEWNMEAFTETQWVTVRIVATGLCHTDLSVRSGVIPFPLPGVLGHEGTGMVETVGSAVQRVTPGDHMLATFTSCGRCTDCKAGIPLTATASCR